MSDLRTPTWRDFFHELLSLDAKLYLPELAEDFDEDFRSGLIRGLFIKRDQRLVGVIFNEISSRLSHPDFRDQVVALYRKHIIEAALQTGIDVTLEYYAHVLKAPIVISTSRNIEGACWETLEKYCASMYACTFAKRSASPEELEFFKTYYLCFTVAELLFSHLSKRSESRFVNPRDSLFAHEYASQGIDLFKCDDQFNTYGLITVVDEIEFSDLRPLEPFDGRVDKLVRLDASAPVVWELVSLKAAGYIGTLSFRPRFNVGLRSVPSASISLENFEQGRVFDLSRLDTPALDKLYSETYDTLWVNIGASEITFEEILSEIVIEGDYFVTQVVHLQHSMKDGSPVINHIDHEYIYYTLEEYEARQFNQRQKGTGRPRIKTFKVDRACIPFTLPDGRWFLYLVLENHFKNIGLVKEYFEKII